MKCDRLAFSFWCPGLSLYLRVSIVCCINSQSPLWLPSVELRISVQSTWEQAQAALQVICHSKQVLGACLCSRGRIRTPQEAFPQNSPSNSAWVQKPHQGQHSLGKKEGPPAGTHRIFINTPNSQSKGGYFRPEGNRTEQGKEIHGVRDWG